MQTPDATQGVDGMTTDRKQRLDSDFLTAAQLILDDYQAFLAQEAPDDGVTKAFAARHTAGRGALTHFELLLKVASEAGDEAQLTAMAELLAAWRRRMPAALFEEPPEADHDGA
jgi:hypothetical protein